MRAKGWEERMRALDGAAMAFGVAQRAATVVDGSEGWLRAVRRAVGVPGKELAGRLGVVGSDIYRMEIAEGRGVIELKTLRRAAEALGCELVYGLAPKEGTLAQMAAALEAGRAQKRAEGYERKLEKGREQRREAAEKRWLKQQRDAHAEEWRRFREAWRVEMPENVRPRPPKALRETPWWREAMRKQLKKKLRKAGIRLR